MPDPAQLPTLEQWNAEVMAQAAQLANHTPSGVRCDHLDTEHKAEPPQEMLDIPDTTGTADLPGLIVTTVKCVCPLCGNSGLRYLSTHP